MDLDNGDSSVGNNQNDTGEMKPAYSMPGILHFIQHEWSRFEMERAQWEVERAELQAKIAFLQGERTGQENLKRDLIRRIKMLEFALRQERAKLHKLKFGTELNVETKMNDSLDDSKSNDDQSSNANSNMSWKHGRQLLRKYLQEVGYSDTILDVRSQRVRALLGSNFEGNPGANQNENQQQQQLVNGNLSDEEKDQQQDDNKASMSPSDADVFKDFNFLNNPENETDNDVIMTENDGTTEMDGPKSIKQVEFEDTEDAAMALAEFDFLNPSNDDDDSNASTDWSVDQNKMNQLKEQYHKEKRQNKKKGGKRPVKKDLQSMLDTLRGTDNRSNEPYQATEEDTLPFTVGGPKLVDDSIENALGLGALAGLTVANEADVLTYDISTATKEPFRKTWTAKYALRSHFDGIRSIRFLPSESGVITASEDHTMKLWNLDKPLPSKRTQALDVEPIYTFRGHVGAVLCLEVGSDGKQCFSGGMDSDVRVWNVPNINTDHYDTYDPTVPCMTLKGHSDAIWSLSHSSTRQQLLSASSDMTVRLWNVPSASPQDALVQTYKTEADGVPTCIEFVQCDSNHAVVSHHNGKVVLYDLETGKTPVMLADDDGGRVNYCITHPTMPITITAHDDRHIKFFDNVSGKMIHSMVAHLDAVTSLSVDPNGLYLLSGSHDSSIRLWNLDNKTCIQDVQSHRRKFDEAIYSVAFHPNATYIGSAGADALAKVFV